MMGMLCALRRQKNKKAHGKFIIRKIKRKLEKGGL